MKRARALLSFKSSVHRTSSMYQLRINPYELLLTTTTYQMHFCISKHAAYGSVLAKIAK